VRIFSKKGGGEGKRDPVYRILVAQRKEKRETVWGGKKDIKVTALSLAAAGKREEKRGGEVHH